MPAVAVWAAVKFSRGEIVHDGTGMDESGTLLWGAPLNHPSPSPLASCASNLAKGSGTN
jgi:hypothetical protein